MLDLILKASKDDEDSLIKLLEKFDPLINKCSYQLPYEEAKTDLIIFFIEMVKNFNVKNISHNGQVVNYISKAIHNKKVDLYRKYCKNTNKEIFLSLNTLVDKNSNENDTKILIDTILKSLIITDLQKKILKKNLLKATRKWKSLKC